MEIILYPDWLRFRDFFSMKSQKIFKSVIYWFPSHVSHLMTHVRYLIFQHQLLQLPMFHHFNVVALQLLLSQAVSEMILVLQSVPKQGNQMGKGHNGHLLAPPVVNVSMTHAEWLIIHIFQQQVCQWVRAVDWMELWLAQNRVQQTITTTMTMVVSQFNQQVIPDHNAAPCQALNQQIQVQVSAVLQHRANKKLSAVQSMELQILSRERKRKL